MYKRLIIPLLLIGSALASCEKSELEEMCGEAPGETPVKKITAADDKNESTTSTDIIIITDDDLLQDESTKDEKLEEVEDVKINIKEVSDGDDEADDGDDS